MEDSEYYVQIFLFVATILCYVILAICIFYGIYYCCLQACILRAKRRHHQRDNLSQSSNEEGQDAEVANRGLRRVKLLNPFQRDDKNANNSPISNTSKNIPSTDTNCSLADDTISDNIVISSILDERNPFVDKKYYDIFVA